MKTLSATLFLVAGLYVGAAQIGPLPALGHFLDPVHGVWSGARGATLPASVTHEVPGLSSGVEIIYDDRRVPHIFAQTVEDALRGLGYAVARDRLFQLEVQTRATAGTLTELVGEAALPLDRRARQLGLAWSAEKNFGDMRSGSSLAGYLQAYADGVNAWIDQMGPRDLPLEYHLLSRAPMRWLPQYSIYLLKRMGWTLAMKNTERRKQAVSALVGWDAADALFPVNSPIQEPIQPTRRSELRFDSSTLPPPGDPDPESALQLQALGAFMGPMDEARSGLGETVLGSNNWAVAPTRSASGNAILAGDPHLDLQLPSIWYEVHLIVPGELDVYGVTIPGTPAITIGFNREVAWSFTNTGSDVMDLYRETVDATEGVKNYLLDGEWLPFQTRVESYTDHQGAVLAVDTILHTHRGPVSTEGGEYLSMRWTVLEDQGELGSLMEINRANSVEEWLTAMESWVAPTQNGLVADRGGNIAIRASGRYPIRPVGTRGDRIYDGSTSENDWQGWRPVERYPGAVNPEQGYLASSNQQPVDPAEDTTFVGADWPSPWRALRINELLRAGDAFTAEDLAAFQTDPGSARADLFVPAFLEAASEAGAEGPSTVREAHALLELWNRRYTKENKGAALFEVAMTRLAQYTWDELGDSRGGRVATPRSAMLAQLLKDPDSPWWDDRSTVLVVESRDDILRASLEDALVSARSLYGSEDGDGWRWDRIQTANLYHLLNIEAFSALGLPIQGGPETLNPVSGSGRHGASWRMVVELGERVEAKGTYPGGQSGNPLSPDYLDRLEFWTGGELRELRFPRTASELEGVSRGVASLRPSGTR